MKSIKNYPHYKISKDGEIYSTHLSTTPKVKKSVKYKKSGYMYNELTNSEGRKKFLVHRLVAETYIPNPNNLTQVNHKNGVRTDNRLENLEWVSCSDNHKHAFRVLGKKANKTNLGNTGGKSASAKVVLQYDKEGNFIAEYAATTEAAEILNISAKTISKCALGNLKTYKGFIWKYKETK